MRNFLIALLATIVSTLFFGCADNFYPQYYFGGSTLNYPIVEEFEIKETGTIIQFKTLLLGKEKNNILQVQIKQLGEYFQAYPLGYTNRFLQEATSINLGKGYYLYLVNGNDGERHIFLNATLRDKNWSPFGSFELEYPTQNLSIVPGKKGSYQNIKVLKTLNCTITKRNEG